jgi:hypothetical protein
MQQHAGRKAMSDPYAKGDEHRQDGKGGGGGGGDSAPPSPNRAAAANFDIKSLGLHEAANLRQFLMSPCPAEAGIMQTYIKRKKSTFSKMFPEYRVYLKVGRRYPAWPASLLFFISC